MTPGPAETGRVQLEPDSGLGVYAPLMNS